MRLVMMVISGVFLLLTLAVAADEKPRCEQCGMFFENSPTQVSVMITDGDTTGAHIYESLGCFYNYMVENYADSETVEIGSVSVLDYTTFGTKKLVMLDAEDAQFLYGTSALKGSMAPFIAAFDSPKDALTAIDDLGGEVLDFDEVMDRIAGEGSGGCSSCAGCQGCPKGEPEAAAYVCPMGCDSSDKPGKCSKCGMNLVKQEG